MPHVVVFGRDAPSGSCPRRLNGMALLVCQRVCTAWRLKEHTQPRQSSPFRTLSDWLQGGQGGPSQWADLPPTTSAVLGSFLAYLSAPRPDGECCYVGSGVGALLATALSASADEASMLDHATQAVLLAMQLDILLEESKAGKADWESIIVATPAQNSWPEDIFVSARMRDKVELTGRHASLARWVNEGQRQGVHHGWEQAHSRTGGLASPSLRLSDVGAVQTNDDVLLVHKLHVGGQLRAPSSRLSWREGVLASIVGRPDDVTNTHDFVQGCLSGDDSSQVLLFGMEGEGNPVRPAGPALPSDVAIVGYALHLPAGAGEEDLTTKEALWDFLAQQRSAHMTRQSPNLSERQRFLLDLLPKEVASAGANLYRTSPTLDDTLFHTNSKETAAMDDQIKDLYHVAYRALEDAGYSSEQWDTTRFGCFVGTSTEDYTSKQPDTDDVGAHHLTGTLRSFQSGRLSHCFGWRGPTAVYDSGCASSFTALHAAWQSLQLGECSAALVGASHVASEWTAPTSFSALQRAHFLTTDGGQCKPFSTHANGYCRAEGTVVVVLQRLDDALRMGSNVLGVIRGSSAAAMSSPQSITRPMAEHQMRAMHAALAAARLAPTDVSCIEAHGPGTLAGDPQELEALSRAFSSASAVPVGSIKGNVGHSEAASGLSSLLKVLLQLDRKHILPLQTARHPTNPALAPFLADGALRLARALEPWPSSTPRRALINNFGAAGAVHCIVVEEASQPGSWQSCAPPPPPRVLPFVVSAPTADRLHERLLQLRLRLSTHAPTPLALLARGMGLHQPRHREHTTLLAATVDELQTALLDAAKRCETLPSPSLPREVVFIFAGQGKAAVDPTATDIYHASATFRAVVDECLSVGATLFAAEDRSLLWRFTLQYAQARTYSAWGVQATAVGAHSFGEYAMLLYAGVTTLEDTLRLLACRGRLVRDHCAAAKVGSAMLSVRCETPTMLQEMVAGAIAAYADVAISCRNNATSCTLSGSMVALTAVVSTAAASSLRIKTAWLPHVDAAYHNRHYMRPVLADMAHCADGILTRPAQLPILSTVLGDVMPAGTTIAPADYFVKQMADVCDFAAAVDAYGARDESVWVEMGSDASTLSLLASHGGARLASMSKSGVVDRTMLASSLKAGADECAILHDLTAHTLHTWTPPPPLPFHTKPEGPPIRRRRAVDAKTNTTHALTATLDRAALIELAEGHTVGGANILPAGGYIALLASAITADNFEVTGLQMPVPFIPQDACEGEALQLSVQQGSSGTAEVGPFCIESTTSGQVCARGSVRALTSRQLSSDLATLAPLLLAKRRDLLASPGCLLNRRLTYDLFSRAVQYGPQYRRISTVHMDTTATAAYAVIPDEQHESSDDKTKALPFASSHFDSLVHVAGLIVNTSPSRSEGTVYVAHSLNRLRICVPSVASPRTTSGALALASFDEELHEATVSVYVFDENDSVYMAMEGLVFKRLPARTLASIVSAQSTPLRGPDRQSTYDEPKEALQKHLSRSQDIGHAVARALDADHVGEDEELEALGLDSISALDLVAELREISGQRLPLDFCLKHPTLASIREALEGECSMAISTLDSLSSGSTCSDVDTGCTTPEVDNVSLPESVDCLVGVAQEIDDITNSLVQVQNGTGTPLILIHDGGGTSLPYRQIAPLGRPVYAIQNPGLLEGRGIGSLGDVVARYRPVVACVEAKHGAVILGGWSLGAVVAFELAVQSPSLVSSVLLIDPPPPGAVPLDKEAFCEVLGNQDDNASSTARDLIMTQFTQNAQMLEGYTASPPKQPAILIRASEAWEQKNDQIARTHPWLCRRGPNSQEGANHTEWARCLGPSLVDVLATSGNHFELFDKDHVALTTQSIAKAVTMLEGRTWEGLNIDV